MSWEWTRSLWGKYPYPTDKKVQAQRENLDAGRTWPVCCGAGRSTIPAGSCGVPIATGTTRTFVQGRRISGGGAPMSLTSDPLASVPLVSGGVQRGAPLWSFFAPLIRS